MVGLGQKINMDDLYKELDLIDFEPVEVPLTEELLQKADFDPSIVAWWPEAEAFHIEITGKDIFLSGKFTNVSRLIEALDLCKVKNTITA